MPQNTCRNAPISQLVGRIFKKSYILFQFCVLTRGLTAVTIWLKTMPKRAKTALFLFSGWDTQGIDMRCHEMWWDCSLDTELCTYVRYYVSFSWNVLGWAEYCGPLYKRLESNPPKVWILGGLSPQNKTLSKTLRCFPECGIKCRLIDPVHRQRYAPKWQS